MAISNMKPIPNVDMSTHIPLKEKNTVQRTSISDFVHTLWLFTKADFATFAIPTTLFAIFGALSGPVLTTNSTPSAIAILLRVPAALLIVWANLLVFDIANQRHPEAVAEDAVNKPSRPLPSGRITVDQSRQLLLVALPIVLALSWVMGPWQETLLLFASTWMYNDLKGCDEDFITRNFLIALGYALYSSAALRVATGSDHAITPTGFHWVLLIGIVIFITEHICDIKDQEGDKLRGRRSAPIVLGDEITRWSVAIPVMLSSIVCPLFFSLGISSYVFTCGFGFVIAFRTLKYRDLVSDKKTWKLWAAWTCSLFVLPLLKDPSSLTRLVCAMAESLRLGTGCVSSVGLVAMSSAMLLLQTNKVYGQVASLAFVGNSTLIEASKVLEVTESLS